MKRHDRLVAVLMALMLAALPLGAALADTTVSVSRTTNVYSAASDRTVIIGSLEAGTRVQVSSFDSNWAQVVLGGGVIGFVPTDALNFGAPVPTLAPPTQIIATATVASGPLAVHSAATLRAPTIATLSAGQRVQITAYVNDWSEILLSSGQIGYVQTASLRFGSATPSPAPHQKVETAGANATVTTTNHGPMHLRAKPSFDADILETVANGSRVRALRQDGGWYYVLSGSRNGYMDAEFVTLDAGAGLGDGAEGFFDASVANPTDGEVLHLRARPTIESDSLGTYRNGTYVQVLMMGTQWHRVIVDGIHGYMDATYVRLTDDGATPTGILTGGTDGQVTIRATASAQGAVLTTLPADSLVTIVAPDDEWTQVEAVVDGTTRIGYVENASIEQLFPDQILEVG